MNFDLHHGDCLQVLATLPDACIDAVVTDPPYGINFMGEKWDYDVPSKEIWEQCLRVLKPGGHLLAFAGTRTQHRMAVNIEDAGFEIRDMIAWCYGSGFPKSLDVSKAIDKRGGSSVAWFGPWFRKWRAERGITQKQVAALFPSKAGGLTGCVANWELGFNLPTPEQFNLIRDTFGLPFESINAAEREVVGTKEWSNSVSHFVPGEDHSQRVRLDITAPATPEAQQWDGWGTALKPSLEPITVARKPFKGNVAANVLEHGTGAINIAGCRVGDNSGRWPANLLHDGSDETSTLLSDAARFFYTPKASTAERQGVTHPTVKPLDLMAYLCRLITPPNGTILDPFMGSGTTIKAAMSEGFKAIGIERDPDYFAMAQQRLNETQLGLQLL